MVFIFSFVVSFVSFYACAVEDYVLINVRPCYSNTNAHSAHFTLCWGGQMPLSRRSFWSGARYPNLAQYVDNHESWDYLSDIDEYDTLSSNLSSFLHDSEGWSCSSNMNEFNVLGYDSSVSSCNSELLGLLMNSHEQSFPICCMLSLSSSPFFDHDCLSGVSTSITRTYSLKKY